MVILLLSFACILYLACFHPFLELPHPATPFKSELQQVLSANLHNIKARIAKHIEVEAAQCLFSEGTMIFHDVYLTDHLAGSFHAKKITWEVGSEEIFCSEMIEGRLHAERIAVQSKEAIYNMKSSALQWSESTRWQVEP
jgi:hypothetical protein